ncbi:hypothetical protein GGF50DRAFT_121260 [Schizophyllum commune]
MSASPATASPTLSTGMSPILSMGTSLATSATARATSSAPSATARATSAPPSTMTSTTSPALSTGTSLDPLGDGTRPPWRRQQPLPRARRRRPSLPSAIDSEGAPSRVSRALLDDPFGDTDDPFANTDTPSVDDPPADISPFLRPSSTSATSSARPRRQRRRQSPPPTPTTTISPADTDAPSPLADQHCPHDNYDQLLDEGGDALPFADVARASFPRRRACAPSPTSCSLPLLHHRQ